MKRTLKRLVFNVLLAGLAFSAFACAAQTPSIPVAQPSSPSPAPTLQATPTLPAVPTPAQPSPTMTKPCAETKGQIQSLSFPGKDGYSTIEFELYLPPCYGKQTSKTYPLLILLHGSGSDKNQWPSLGLAKAMDQKIAQGMPPFLVACPTIENIRGDLYKITDFVGQEIPGYLARHYALRPGRDNLALGGLSYGAIWTLRTATRFPERFAKLGMHSTAVDAPDMVAFSHAILALPYNQKPQILIDTGQMDEYRWSATKLDEVLNHDGIAHQWVYQPGYHEPGYWSENLPSYLDFYACGWN
ncbi:MAG: alpha/beta hydrolase-fold protein [Anaerolineaceae bacterium]|nr:alpha/beta hydrolase-fold protein [Anaerolineaceae bacterium]